MWSLMQHDRDKNSGCKQIVKWPDDSDTSKVNVCLVSSSQYLQLDLGNPDTTSKASTGHLFFGPIECKQGNQHGPHLCHISFGTMVGVQDQGELLVLIPFCWNGPNTKRTERSFVVQSRCDPAYSSIARCVCLMMTHCCQVLSIWIRTIPTQRGAVGQTWHIR